MSSSRSAISEYAEQMVSGLNAFLEHSEHSVAVLETREGELSTVVFGFEESSVPDDVNVDESYSFEDGGFSFEFGMQGSEYFVVRTDIGDLEVIDMDEHVGEGVACIIGDDF